MTAQKKDHNTLTYLEQRVKHLEDVERFVVDALELAVSLGDFQESINKFRDVSVILEETSDRVQRLIPFEAISFFLVDENSQDFILKKISPNTYRSSMQAIFENLINDGTFAWALREKRPIIISTKNHSRILLHVMATSARIRGMCIGVLHPNHPQIMNVSLSLLSIIMVNSANAIESYELYKTIKEINSNLERIDNYRMLFDAAPDGVEVLDALGNILDSNDAQKKILGYTQEYLLGNHSSDYFSEKSRASFTQNYSSLKEHGYWEGEIELMTAGGSLLPVWRKEKAIYDKKHKFIGAVVYNRDISLRKRAEEERHALEARLKRAEKMEALGFLAGGVAHDLNNVLGGLVSYPELLLMQLPKDSPMRKSILTIQKSGEKAAAIVEDLLTLARRGIYEPQVVNLNEVVLDYLKTPEYEKLKLFHAPFQLIVDLDGDLMNIKGSQIHLSKMVTNLMSNAVEAISEKGEVHVRTESCYLDAPIRGYDVVEEGSYVRLCIADNGSGIADKDIDKIFEPFYTKKVMGKSGTGLGLAVVWGTVKDHHGYIDVQSDPGQGSAFTIYFPVTNEELTGAPQALSLEQYMGKGQSILVVDDVAEQRDVATTMLTKLGYHVRAVSSGLEAVAFAKTHKVDLVLLDMIMDPGIDGLETYQRLLEIHPDQKAIIVSGFSETERVKNAQRLGAGTYVRKPYRLEKIGLAVRDELNKTAGAKPRP